MPVAADKTKILEIAQEIENYLAEHPNAADSLPGVKRWWLSRRHYSELHEHVKAALEYLESQHIVAQHTNADGTTIYRRFSPSSAEKH